MVSTNQVGRDTEYTSSYERQLELWPDDWLLILEPMTKEIAQKYLGAANKVNASTEVKEHFYNSVKRHTESE